MREAGIKGTGDGRLRPPSKSPSTLIDAPKMFVKTFSHSTPSFADVNDGKATAGDLMQ